MFKRLLCVILILALAGSLWYVAFSTKDPDYSKTAENAADASTDPQAGSAEDAPLVLWYTDESLTDYLSSVALSYQQDHGTKVDIVLKDGVQFLETINANSLADDANREEAMPDLYITSHDNLLRAFLSGLATDIADPENILTTANFPKTAIDAVTCYDHLVAYPLYYETNFFLYNKTYMASIAQNKIEEEIDLEEGEEATRELEESGEPEEEPEDTGAAEGDDADAADPAADAEAMGEEDAVADPEVLARLATMIPETIEDIKTFANNYNAPEAVESVFKWDVTDIFYNYFFVGNYMEVGGEHGDNAAIFNIYNKQAVECLRAYQAMNQFFSIDPKADNYSNILQDFIDGKMVFTVATTDAIKRIHEAKNKGEFEFEYGVSTLPDISSLLKARGLSVTDAVAINGYSKKQAEANMLATYLAHLKASDLYMKSGKVSCCRNVEYEDAEIANVMAEYEKSMPLPKMVETGNYWVQLEIAFTKVWNGADPDETLRELSDTIGAQIEEIKANLPTQESFNAGAGNFVK